MFIGCQFFSEYAKTYTYTTLRDNIKVGDFVVVESPKGNTVVKVVSTNLPTPSYQCKPIIKKVRL